MKNHEAENSQQSILELTVNNHPGVMSHVVGLFSRRAFNVDGIICMPLPKGDISRIWLRVREGERLSQVVSQLNKLHDVHEVRRHPVEHAVFSKLESFFRPD